MLLAMIGSLLVVSRVLALDPSIAPSKQRPRIGMNMSEALAYYGEPFHRGVVAGREQWYYHLKFAEVYGRAFVPFRFESDNVYPGTITFGPDKKIVAVDWTTPAQ